LVSKIRERLARYGDNFASIHQRLVVAALKGNARVHIARVGHFISFGKSREGVQAPIHGAAFWK